MQKHLLHQGRTLSSALKEIPCACSFHDTSDRPNVELPPHFQGSTWGDEPALQNNQTVIAGNPENVTCVYYKGSGVRR